MEIRWDRAAEDDLENILCHLEKEFSIASARKFRAQVVELTEKLSAFPQIGKHEPLLAEVLDGQIRSIPITKLCKLMYMEVEADALLVIAYGALAATPTPC